MDEQSRISPPPRVRACPTPEAVGEAAAAELRRRARAAIAARGRFAVALSGGSTPEPLFRALARGTPEDFPWGLVHLFWGDERAVPPDDPASNYRSAREQLLTKVPIAEAQVHRMRGEEPDPARAAAAYEEELRRFFDPAPECFPRFDLVLLGMGAEGHTASLFPGTAALEEERRWVVANRAAGLETVRLTLTLPVLNAARCALFLVTGAGKAATLARVLEGPAGAAELPARLVRPAEGELLWLIDHPAAGRLESTEVEPF